MIPQIRSFPAERSRRENLRKARYNVKLFYNSIETCSTLKIGMDSDFVLSPVDASRIRSVDIPRSLKVQIFEAGMIRDVFCGEFTVSFPAATVTAKFPSDFAAEFSNQKSVGERGMGGICHYSVFWGEDKSGRLLVPANLPSTGFKNVGSQLAIIDYSSSNR